MKKILKKKLRILGEYYTKCCNVSQLRVCGSEVGKMVVFKIGVLKEISFKKITKTL